MPGPQVFTMDTEGENHGWSPQPSQASGPQFPFIGLPGHVPEDFRWPWASSGGSLSSTSSTSSEQRKEVVMAVRPQARRPQVGVRTAPPNMALLVWPSERLRSPLTGMAPGPRQTRRTGSH